MFASNGTDSVTVRGITEVTLRFGVDPSLPDGAFAEAASEKIFEDKNSGMLAQYSLTDRLGVVKAVLYSGASYFQGVMP